MGPENFQNHQEENQNTGWENMQDIEKATPKSMILEKIKNNNNVKKVFAAVGLAAGLAAGVAGLSSNSEPATQNLATETADINYDEMLGQIQNIKDNFSNVADRISAQRERDAREQSEAIQPEVDQLQFEMPDNVIPGDEWRSPGLEQEENYDNYNYAQPSHYEAMPGPRSEDYVESSSEAQEMSPNSEAETAPHDNNEEPAGGRDWDDWDSPID